MKQISFTALKTAELVDVEDLPTEIRPDEVRGRTVVSLTSPGTEINWGFLGANGGGFPLYPGYSCVFEVTETGSEVTDLEPGSFVYTMGKHAERQKHSRAVVLPLPEGLAPEKAVFARIVGVSMTTLNTTTVHPPATVLITGLGPVGNLAAQLFDLAGYDVVASDPLPARREAMKNTRVSDVRASLEDANDIRGEISLHVECSGHEQAVLDGCQLVRERGEVVLVGVPWQARTELTAFALLHAVFNRYVVLRSGWEHEIPGVPTKFAGHCRMDNYEAALRWIADGRIRVDGMASSFSPADAQKVYTGLLERSIQTPAALFDWRE